MGRVEKISALTCINDLRLIKEKLAKKFISKGGSWNAGTAESPAHNVTR